MMPTCSRPKKRHSVQTMAAPLMMMMPTMVGFQALTSMERKTMMMMVVMSKRGKRK